MLITTRAIVLKSVKFGDAKLIIDMFTQTHGRMSFIVNIAKTNKGKIKRQYFQLFNVLELVVDYRNGKELQHIRDIRLAGQFPAISLSPGKLSITMFLGEFLNYATMGEQANVPLFEFICSAMEWLDASASGYVNFHLVFMAKLSRFIGLYPNVESYVEGDVFDLRAATFTHTIPMHPDYVPAVASSNIVRLLRMDFSNMHLFAMSHSDRNSIVDFMVDYYRIHLPVMPALVSLDVVRDVFR